MGPTQAELDNARDQLDVAQEELVGLMERCDRLEQDLEVARRKNRVYQVGSAPLLLVHAMLFEVTSKYVAWL
jgi:hypothetical protein